MSTKKSKGKIANKAPTLLFELENTVLAMESKGVDENTIFGLVNCILKGFIRNGEFTPEYLSHVRTLMQERSLSEEELDQMAEAERVRKIREAFGVGSSIGT
jgi:hypothetical protein